MTAFKLFIFMLFCLASGVTKLTCQNVSMYNQDYFQIIYKPICKLSEGQHLKHVFNEWRFAEVQLNLKHFPVDSNRQNYVRVVHNALFSHVTPTPFKTGVKLAAVWDHVLTDLLDLHPKVAHKQDFIQFVSGNKVLRGSIPLAHRYGGHQFGVWADQLGDGRAHLLGEYFNHISQRWELQLKGSGKTPYSRQGDGRAVVRSSVREFLASEAMHFLGIRTSRTASIAVSDDKVIRDQFYNGNMKYEKTAVVLRLAPSWIRFGSFEILTQKGEIGLLKQLKNFVIEQYFPSIDLNDPNHILEFFDMIVTETATMIAQWQSVGFVHGVMNTDNFSILSITIDYGPFRFMDGYDPEMVSNTSDEEERYSYEKQPDVAWYNLNKLRVALEPLFTVIQQKEQMNFILQSYADIYKSLFMKIFKEKLGITGVDIRDEYLIGMLLKMMEDSQADFTMTFRQLSEWSEVNISLAKVPQYLWAIYKFSTHEFFPEFCQLYVERIRASAVPEKQRLKMMNKVNPRYVLRNWMAQEAIEKAEKDDFSGIHILQQVLSQPYSYQEKAELAGFADLPPSWASEVKVSCSS